MSNQRRVRSAVLSRPCATLTPIQRTIVEYQSVHRIADVVSSYDQVTSVLRHKPFTRKQLTLLRYVERSLMFLGICPLPPSPVQVLQVLQARRWPNVVASLVVSYLLNEGRSNLHLRALSVCVGVCEWTSRVRELGRAGGERGRGRARGRRGLWFVRRVSADGLVRTSSLVLRQHRHRASTVGRRGPLPSICETVAVAAQDRARAMDCRSTQTTGRLPHHGVRRDLV